MLFRRTNFPPNRVRRNCNDSVYRYGKFFRRPDPRPVVYAAGRNGGYIRSNTGTVPSVCKEPVTGSHALGSSHRLGRCCLWWTALPSHGIGSASVSLILLFLLMVDSDDLNKVTLLFQPTCIQSYSIANMIRAYSGILHGVRTLYGQMAEGNSPVLTCIRMIGASVSMLRQGPSVSSAVRRITPIAIPPTVADIILFFTRISQGSELSDR